MNSLLIIHPYKTGGTWVFDDPAVGLVREPFVAGADVLLDRMTESIPNATQGVTVLFAAQPFPGYQYEVVRRREEFDGNWYYSPAHDLEGWLCPALLEYFPTAPDRIYLQVKPKAA